MLSFHGQFGVLFALMSRRHQIFAYFVYILQYEYISNVPVLEQKALYYRKITLNDLRNLVMMIPGMCSELKGMPLLCGRFP